jgi:hypothetical protein
MKLFSHHDHPRGRSGENRLFGIRPLRQLRAAFKMIRRSMAAAKIHRLRNELMFRASYHDDWAAQPYGQDHRELPHAARFPQRPLILGDKWDS